MVEPTPPPKKPPPPEKQNTTPPPKKKTILRVSWRKIAENHCVFFQMAENRLHNCATGALAFSAIRNVAETQRLDVLPSNHLFPSHHLTVCIHRQTDRGGKEKGGEERERDRERQRNRETSKIFASLHLLNPNPKP
jgi:hypothetical protein